MLRLWSKKHRPPEPIHDNDPVPSSCSLCHDFKPNNTHHVLNLTIEHLELRQSRQEKCRYCMLLRGVIKQLDKGDLRTTKIYLTVEAGKPVIVSTNASRRNDSYQTWYFLYRPHGSSVPSFPLLGEQENLHNDLGSKGTIDFIKSCLHACEENKSDSHKACDHTLDASVPKRLIFIAGDMLQLVETASSAVVRYCALSYQWGPSPLFTFKTTSSNYSQMTQGFPTKVLPVLLQHAVRVTSLLGSQYLWVDAICIVQDDLDDWEQEAAKMGQYYRGAHLTIATASALDVNTPILVPRKPIEITQSSFYQNRYSNPYEYEIMNDDGSTSKIIGRQFPGRAGLSLTNDEPLAMRAWTCQENVLSRRVVHFTASEVIWECCSQQRFENGAVLLSSIGLAYQFAHSSDDMEHYWKTLVMDYSRRALTFEKDRLPAVSGLATEIQALTSSQYMAGLFRDWLHSDLLWSSNFNKNLTTGPPLAKTNAAVPSWSWVSITGGVDYDLDFCQDSIKHSAIKIHDVHFRPSGNNQFGEAADASLTLTGRVFPVTLTCTDNSLAYKYELSWPGSNGIFMPDCVLGSIPMSGESGCFTVGRMTQSLLQSSEKSFTAQIHALYAGGGRYLNAPAIDDLEDLQKSRIPSWLASRVPWYEFSYYFLVLAEVVAQSAGPKTFIRVGVFKSRNGGPPRNAKKTIVRLV